MKNELILFETADKEIKLNGLLKIALYGLTEIS